MRLVIFDYAYLNSSMGWAFLFVSHYETWEEGGSGDGRAKLGRLANTGPSHPVQRLKCRSSMQNFNVGQSVPVNGVGRGGWAHCLNANGPLWVCMCVFASDMCADWLAHSGSRTSDTWKVERERERESERERERERGWVYIDDATITSGLRLLSNATVL